MKQQETAAEYVALDKIKPWAKNPRINKDAVEKVADSIRRFGFGAPIVARRENGEIIAGHTRYKAAKLLGLKTVPVRYMDVDEKTAHQMALADNKIGEISEWDKETLGEVLQEFSFKEAHDAGFGWKELGELVDADDLPNAGASLGDGLTYSVVVECEDEDGQSALLERLESEGFKCKPLVT